MARSMLVPGYADSFKKCSALKEPDKADCLRELDGASAGGHPVNNFFEDRVREQEQQREEEREDQRKQALCPNAKTLITTAINSGKYGRAWLLRKDTSACPNAAEIASVYLTQLRRVPASTIVSFANNTIADDYWNTMSIVEWMDYAARGSFVSDRGVQIIGNVSQQFDDYLVINSPYADQSMSVIHLDKRRYVQPGSLAAVIGRFRELAPFENRFGTRRDLPVFDLLYAYSGY